MTDVESLYLGGTRRELERKRPGAPALRSDDTQARAESVTARRGYGLGDAGWVPPGISPGIRGLCAGRGCTAPGLRNHALCGHGMCGEGTGTGGKGARHTRSGRPMTECPARAGCTRSLAHGSLTARSRRFWLFIGCLSSCRTSILVEHLRVRLCAGQHLPPSSHGNSAHRSACTRPQAHTCMHVGSERRAGAGAGARSTHAPRSRLS